jgi:glycerol-3-phosphate dehydrogenase
VKNAVIGAGINGIITAWELFKQGPSKQQIHQACPNLNIEVLIKGFSYYDRQMDDYQLGLWALEKTKKQPDQAIFGQTEVLKITNTGKIDYQNHNNQQQSTFGKVINLAGPWVEQLPKQRDNQHKYTPDYLINVYNNYFKTPINKQKIIIKSFVGVRPLIKSANNPNKDTRAYASLLKLQNRRRYD